ncbi:GEVED domain-containing protein [Aquimarina sp. 2201CG5-10]|uniref:GEVED domain-containing protein n=1 Tax=Aquimarina callyspongiae TaxID=3098150 RepID=UPI002AB38C09|nr:GEVED domain-containing protein [Aquimarina sp. 2201CG5-10]MDY8135635.1 GEVED domain-containing protein [Aquimarina sp. 2201CG5-10]
MKLTYFLVSFLFLTSLMTYGQKNENKAFYHGKISSVEYVSPMSSRPQDLRPSDNSFKEAKDKRSLGNLVVSGKDPQTTNDYFVKNRHQKSASMSLSAPSLVFDTYSSGSQPTDPSLAVGPNHVFVVYNTGFMIYDKAGNQLVGQTAPNPAIFPSGGCCDLTVSYDNAADRWVLSFLGSGAQVAVSDGPDPVNSGWYVYNISSISDYQKLSIWSDGYYITDNTGSSNKIWALERSKMLTGDSNAQIVGFNLPGIVTSGFYSPQALNVTDANLPAAGGATIVYMQDNAWSGVSTDHIKLWTVNVDWNNSNNSTISNPQQINTTPFIGVFDGGSFSNLPQPGGGATIDALQATIMNQAQFRKFATHNSAIFNFVVDTDGGSGKLAGVRWYEFRQSGDNQPWSLHQEGTYTAPDGRHAWNASMAMDAQGNIGMGYTSMSGPSTSSTVRVSSYYTGRLSTDPSGVMSGTEQLISNGNANIPSLRYGDYSKIDVDPSDNSSFWFITEYMKNGRKGVVGKFQIQSGPADTQAPTDPTNLVASNITSSGATLNWTASTDNVGVTQYNISINGNVVGTSANTSFNVTGLSPLTTYNASVTAQDAAGNISGSATASFTTLEGSGVTYCDSASTNVNDEYISRVQLNTIDNSSNAQFYSDFTAISTTLNEGQNYSITVTPTWTGTTYSEAYAVWIDYNNNGDFTDSGELVWSKAPSTDTPNTGSFTVPSGTSQTAVRMRVSMKYNGIPTSCETFTYGEVEDYTVNLETGNTPVTYCDSASTNVNDEYISRVQLNTIDNTSGAQFYSDFSSVSTALNEGQNYNITVTPTWTGTTYSEAYAVWIDYNNNGDFTDSGELVWSKAASTDTPNTGSFTVPSGTSQASVKMRVSMKYNGIPTSCETFTYGEVEDYTVNLETNRSETGELLRTFTENSLNNIKLHPNPANAQLNIEILGGNFEEITIFSSTGAIAKKINPEIDSLSIDVSEFASGMYFVRFVSDGLAVTKRFIKK